MLSMHISIQPQPIVIMLTNCFFCKFRCLEYTIHDKELKETKEKLDEVKTFLKEIQTLVISTKEDVIVSN